MKCVVSSVLLLPGAGAPHADLAIELGLGAQPPTPEWGTMVSSGLQYTLSAWWYPTFPGLAIFITALCLNSLGEYLASRGYIVAMVYH